MAGMGGSAESQQVSNNELYEVARLAAAQAAAEVSEGPGMDGIAKSLNVLCNNTFKAFADDNVQYDPPPEKFSKVYPSLPVAGTKMTLRGDDGDVAVTTKLPITQKFDEDTGKVTETALRSGVYLCMVHFTPTVNVNSQKKNFLCCVPTKKKDGTTGICGHAMFQSKGKSTSNNVTGRGAHYAKCHPEIVAAILANNPTSKVNRARRASAVAEAAGAMEDGEMRRSSVPREKALSDYVKMCAWDLRVEDMASRPGFQLFIGNYDPDFAGSPPTTEQFNTELRKQTTEMRNKLIEELSGIKCGVSIGIDLWTSRAGDPYFTLCVRFVKEVDGELVLVRRNLGTRCMHGSHDAESIATAVETMIKSYGYDTAADKACLTLDMFATGVADGALKELNALADHLLIPSDICKEHAFQTAINWALGLNGTQSTAENKPLKDFLGSLREIVAFYNKSSLQMDLLDFYSSADDITRFDEQVVTRWNSVFRLVKKLLDRYEALKVSWQKMAETGKKFDKALLPQGWESVRQLEALLKVCDTATTALQGGEGDFVSTGITKLQRVLSQFRAGEFAVRILGTNSTEDVHVRDMSPMVQEFRRVLISRMEAMQIAEPKSREELLACMFDPMFKWKKYDAHVFDSAVNHLRDALEAMPDGENTVAATPSPPRPKKRRTTSNWQEVSSDMTSLDEARDANEASTAAGDEIRRWLALLKDANARRKLPKEGRRRLLITWEIVGPSFPLCKPIAHTYSIAKQVANHNSEQAFSTAGAVVTPARNRLQAWKVESLLLLRHNAMLDGAYCKLAEAKQDMNDATRAVRETLAGRVSAVATTSRGGATSDACRADEHPQREEDSELLALRSRPNVKERHEDSTPETY